MFGPANLKRNPFVSTEFDYSHVFKAPPMEHVSCSDWLYMSIENDKVDKIYAMRALPFHDLISLKIKYRDESDPCCEIIDKPEFCLLKRIWDCGNLEFNKGIMHYLYHSKHCVHQYAQKERFPQNGGIVNEWYYDIILGHHV